MNLNIGSLNTTLNGQVSLGDTTDTVTITNNDNETLDDHEPDGDRKECRHGEHGVHGHVAERGSGRLHGGLHDGRRDDQRHGYYAAFPSGVLTFAGTAGETQTITVVVNGDTTVEANETLTAYTGNGDRAYGDAVGSHYHRCGGDRHDY